MINHICKNNLEYETTIDFPKPYGDVDSINVYVCKICGKEFTETELKNEQI